MKNATSYGLRALMVLAAVFALSMMLVPAASAQGKQDFTLVNKTGIAISELYIGPTSSDDWGADILGKDTLPNGESTDIIFTPNQKAARWDIQFVDENGKKHTFYDKNLVKISQITLTRKADGTWFANYEY
jgi:hypothetical protein